MVTWFHLESFGKRVDEAESNGNFRIWKKIWHNVLIVYKLKHFFPSFSFPWSVERWASYFPQAKYKSVARTIEWADFLCARYTKRHLSRPSRKDLQSSPCKDIGHSRLAHCFGCPSGHISVLWGGRNHQALQGCHGSLLHNVHSAGPHIQRDSCGKPAHWCQNAHWAYAPGNTQLQTCGKLSRWWLWL